MAISVLMASGATSVVDSDGLYAPPMADDSDALLHVPHCINRYWRRKYYKVIYLACLGLSCSKA
jgi:hypothetical protein